MPNKKPSEESFTREQLAERARKVIDEFGLTKLADALEADPQVVSNWRKRGIPPDRVRDVERVTGASRHDVRPDVFGPASEQAAA